MQDNCKNTILAKTLKLVILPRENAYFQEIEDRKNIKIKQKSMKNRMFIWTSILVGFWEGFGRGFGSQNPWFLHFFIIFSMSNLECNLEGQKIEKKVAKNIFGPNFGAALRSVRAWGEGVRMGGKPA